MRRHSIQAVVSNSRKFLHNSAAWADNPGHVVENKMDNARRVMTAVAFLVGATLPGVARADVEDVDCTKLEVIGIGEPDRFDEVFCMAGSATGLGSGESRRPVGGSIEIIVAYNRATFAAVRFIETNFRTYMELSSLPEHLSDVFAGWEPRN